MLKTGVIRALGTMSGTSLDGVDAAIIVTDGVTISEFGPSGYRPYTQGEQGLLREHLGCWPNDGVTDAAAIVENAHIALMNQFSKVDLAGFHGQTLAHDPEGGRTHQCGDGQKIADALGYPAVWDFRSHDVAQGGQGAPLAPFYHFALAKWIGATAPVAFLNLGGVGNITWVDPHFDDPADDGALLAFDTGPANAPINDAMQARLGVGYDAEGVLAAQGQIHHDVIAAFLSHDFFTAVPPKSLDRDSFANLTRAVQALSDADAIATLTHAVVASVKHGVAQCPMTPEAIYVCGGGRMNLTLMQGLHDQLPASVMPVEAIGLNGDMLEAQAFGYLAVRAARGLPISSPMTTGVSMATSGGRVAIPQTPKPAAPPLNTTIL